jgi:hypothetical protein
MCRALCQGAAVQYMDRQNGVKDFDVWSSMPHAMAACWADHCPSRSMPTWDTLLA